MSRVEDGESAEDLVSVKAMPVPGDDSAWPLGDVSRLCHEVRTLAYRGITRSMRLNMRGS